MNIDKQTFNTLDVLYDDKKWGKRIDPDEWNANFKVLEEGHNELAQKLNKQVADIDVAVQAATSDGGQNINVQYGVGKETLQDALDNVVSDINNRYTKNEVDANIGSNTNSLIANAEYNESTGVFTFTRKDGSSVVIDTVIEKVPSSMSLANEPDGSVSLVVTNQDGSTTKTNVTSLIEDTVINSSDTINATSVTDAVKKVTTYTLVIKPNSIGLSHIDSALTAKFEETQSAKTAAIQAKDNAVAAQNAAVTAKNSAETYASNANTYSTNASVSADESADSALEAKGYAEQAASYKNSAELAKTAAIQAKDDSETAKTYSQTAATEASKSETSAKQSATSASQSASNASQSATSASNSAASALQSKDAAALSEANSLANKNASAESASAAATSETNAASSALAAQTAQTAAEKARDEAQEIVGGDFATRTELNEHANNTTLHFTVDEKTKLSGIETNANNYTHPSSHPADMIIQDSTHKFVTEGDKSTWSAKYTKPSSGIPKSDLASEVKSGLVREGERTNWNNKAEVLDLIDADLNVSKYTPFEIVMGVGAGKILTAIGGVCNLINFDVQNSPNYVVLHRQYNEIKQIVKLTINEDKTFNLEPLELASIKTFSGTLGTSYSSYDSPYYIQNVEFPDITAFDEPIIDLITTEDGFEKEQEEWNKIFKAKAFSGYIAFYVSERTTIPLNFNVKVVK